MDTRATLLVAFVIVFAAMAARPAHADDFDAWILTRGRVQVVGHPTEDRLPVGSLQKPFIIRAWARSHQSDATPKFTCTRTSGCWRPSGHGTLDLRGAIRESCNTYFRLLSRETDAQAMRVSFEEAGFTWSGEMSEAETIGLKGPADSRVTPERLLASYVDLIRTPWPIRDDVRQEMVQGLKDAAAEGTAAGIRLWGLMAKTGTIPALDGASLKTTGLAMVLDDSGFAFLGLLRRGTGREAAIRAGAEIAKVRPGLVARSTSSAASPPRSSPVTTKRALLDPVRVAMLDELRVTDVRLKNLGSGPLDSSQGFIGPGAMVTVRAGDRFSAGQWMIESRKPAFERRVRGSIEIEKREGPIRLIATTTARDYANGILKAELGTVGGDLRVELAAAALRFVARGPRHAEADVCDSTHCAWFVAEGPVPRWLRPDRAVHEKEMAADLSDAEWARTSHIARDTDGPDLWTADCGGDPVSPHFVWGGGDRRIVACPRHPKGSGRVWRREWPDSDLTAIFGSQVQAIDIAINDGQWTLRLTLASRKISGRDAGLALNLSYDEAHRRLAQTLGWDAMPAPASRVLRISGGFAAEGVGSGHRVGLCLAPPRPAR